MQALGVRRDRSKSDATGGKSTPGVASSSWGTQRSAEQETPGTRGGSRGRDAAFSFGALRLGGGSSQERSTGGGSAETNVDVLEQWSVDLLARRALGDGDVILMDYSMPRLGGAMCTRFIRMDPLLDGVRVIGVTGNVLMEDQQRMMRAGAERVLPKPVRRAILLEALNK